MVDIFRGMGINDLDFGMKTASVKNDVISKNIANVDTPGYKSTKLVFDEVMDEYFSGGKKLPMAVTDEGHILPRNNVVHPASLIRKQNNPSLRNDGNDVNLDYEMSELASNAVTYQTLTTVTSSRFMELKSAIQGR